jgi:uroporphyrin-III C-methyltransferase
MQTSSPKIEPKLSIVGAGPGDPDLITLKAIKVLQTADVLLYDALIADSLLEYVPSHCLKIYVGKRSGKHSYIQSTINKMIVDFAFGYGHVVRLKGGDPFVFGRGFEEVEAAANHQIPCQVVPGVSSAMAVPAMQGIPLTHRGLSNSFQVITATDKNGDINPELALAAQSNGTLVVLMGYQKLGEIVSTFKSIHRFELPVAVIENGTTAKEKIITGRVYDIEDKLTTHQLTGPVLLIFGEVVSLHEQFNSAYHHQNAARF